MKIVRYLLFGFIVLFSIKKTSAQGKTEIDTVTGYAVVYSNCLKSIIYERSNWLFYNDLQNISINCFEENLNDSSSKIILNTFDVSNFIYWDSKSYLFNSNIPNTRVKIIKSTILVKKTNGDTSYIYNSEKQNFSKKYFTFYKLIKVVNQQEITIEESEKFKLFNGKEFSNKKRKYKYIDLEKERSACDLYWLNTKLDKL